jgi:ATP-binding cassette, subfamily C, bacterial CydCD
VSVPRDAGAAADTDAGADADTDVDSDAPTGGDLGRPLPGQRLSDRATRPPVDPRLLRFDPAVPRLLGVGALLAFVTALALLVQATALGSIAARAFLDGAPLTDHPHLLWWLAGAIAVRAAATWATALLAHRTAARVKSGLRRAVVAKVARRPPGEVDEDTGALTAALTDGIDALDGVFGGYLPALLAGVIIPVTIVVYVATIDLTSAVVLVVTLPLIPIFMVLIGLAARSATRKRFRALTALSGQLLAVLQGLTVVHVTRSAARIGAAVRDGAERLRTTTLETLRVAFLSALALELLAALSVATVAVIAGVRLAEATGITFEPVLIALLLAPEAFLPLRNVGAQFHANEDGAAAADRLLDLLDDQRTDDQHATADTSTDPARDGASTEVAAPDPATTPIELRGVGVTYRDRASPALRDVDLRLAPGERVAILGASGAGKTTLAAVLLGLRPPDTGEVTIGATALATIDPAAWHARAAWVPQAPAELRGTVREVVTLGCPTRPDDTEVARALRAVGLDTEVAALPDGLDTRIGPEGRGLSAGQRRRLAIARALLRPAGLVVLDEPTGDLDVDAERAVRDALRALAGRRTVVVLTHRVPVAADADRVVVLDEGRVVEAGPPATLAEQAGPYAALVAASAPLTHTEVEGGDAGGSVTGSFAQEGRRSAPVGAAPGAAPPGAASPGAAPPTDPRPPSAWDRTRALAALLRPHRRPLAVAVGAGALTPLAGIVLVAVSTYLISRTALRPNLLDLTAVIVSVRALSIGKGLSRYVERLAGHDVALRVVVDLRVQAYQRLLPQAPVGLARWRSGDVLSRVVADVERLQLALVRGVIPVLGGALASLVVVAIGAVLLPAAGPILLAGLALAGLGVPLLAWRLARRPEQRLASARGALSAELVDLVQAAPELRLLGQLEAAEARVDHLDAEVVASDRAGISRTGGSDAAVQLVLGATAIALVLVAVPAVVAGQLDGVLLASVLILAIASAEAVGPLPMASRSLVSAGTSIARLAEVWDAPPPAPDPATQTRHVGTGGQAPLAPGTPTPPTAPAPPPPRPPLVLDGVTASYPGSTAPAVHDLDLELAPGRRVAVVGRSGAGKSTLASLSVRFLDPEHGVVHLDGTELTGLAGDAVRGVVALSPQDARVLAPTLRDELRLAAPDVADDHLDAALVAAGLDGFVASLPGGLDTPIGEAGSRLSSGQRHRLALARTLLVGAPLVVLDEPTADLDAVTGRAYLADALASAGERGVLLLTHDLRALPVVDEVIVLEYGRIVARGRHEELLASDPAYAARVQLDLGA